MINNQESVASGKIPGAERSKYPDMNRGVQRRSGARFPGDSPFSRIEQSKAAKRDIQGLFTEKLTTKPQELQKPEYSGFIGRLRKFVKSPTGEGIMAAGTLGAVGIGAIACEAPSTTTESQFITTTTEQQQTQLTFEDLVNPDMTAVDIAGIPIVTGDDFQIFSWIGENMNTQEVIDFGAKHGNTVPVWIGENNRKGDYNAYLLCWTGRGALENGVDLFFNAFGPMGGEALLDANGRFIEDENTGRAISKSVSHMAIILDEKPIILLEKDSNPLVDGFLVAGKDTTGVAFYIRFAPDSILSCQDLDDPGFGFIYAFGSEYPGGPSEPFLTKESRYVKAQDLNTLAMYFEPGSTLYTIEKGVGDQFKTDSWQVDEFGKPVAYQAIITRNHTESEKIDKAILN